VASRERTDATSPEILGPVYVRENGGRIEPHRLLWPSWWGRRGEGGRLEPLDWKGVQASLREAWPDRFAKATSPGAPEARVEPLSTEEIEAGLRALKKRPETEGRPVYVRSGHVHVLREAGGLEVSPDPAVGPYTWPLGHDVRPASRSLGAGGCTDCHAPDAAFSFGRILPGSTDAAERPPVERMYELQAGDRALLETWARSFGFRLAFKILGFACAGLVGAVLVVYGLSGLAAVLRCFR
jgi:hypothetical protein